MASAWNVVRARNYNEVSGSENCESPANSPVPDKFKQKMTVNSLRMSFRKRIPLKRINVNETSPDYYRREPWKQKTEADKGKESVTRPTKAEKTRGIAVETSVKKTFFKMTEQLTGAAKKRQLKETPQKSTPRTRYRERLRSPDTPASPAKISGFNSPCYSTPIGQVKSLRRYKRTPMSGNTQGSSLLKDLQHERRRDSDGFSSHLELISCGIQQLESNSSNIMAAINHIGLDYEASPLQRKMKGGRQWKDEARKYTPLSPSHGTSGSTRKKLDKNDHSQPSSTRGMLRRTMTRMSLRVKNRPSLRSTKSASNIEASCYNGPMASRPRKLASLHEYSVQSR